MFLEADAIELSQHLASLTDFGASDESIWEDHMGDR
jgi:hypothetical protein